MKLLFLIPLLCLSACATRPHTYAPPNPGKLIQSTGRVSVAVDRAHQHAREAKTKVEEATTITGQVKEEAGKIKDVPPQLLERIDALESKLGEASAAQGSLEKDLQEADQAKKQVETDKTEYFAAAQKLADSASKERDQRITVEKKLSWYRWHFWLSWIVLGLGVVACIVFALIKFGVITWLKL